MEGVVFSTSQPSKYQPKIIMVYSFKCFFFKSMEQIHSKFFIVNADQIDHRSDRSDLIRRCRKYSLFAKHGAAGSTATKLLLAGAEDVKRYSEL